LIELEPQAGAASAADDADLPIAHAPAMLQVLEIARRAAQTDVGIMLLGESGVGKEVVSRFIHRCSPRARGPFIAINCAAIPDSLLEATLFGYEKGSFTGATQSAPGKFEQAQGGTLLLDEVTEMAAGLQAKLLRVLQEREIERVGGRRRIALDLRIVATSNRNLEQAVKQGVLREDLYYRLSVFPLQIPPLRERVEDILPLAQAMLGRFASQYGLARAPQIDAEARQALLAHAWPGNVRELENVMQRAAILCSDGVIRGADLFLVPGGAPRLPSAAAAARARALADAAVARAPRELDAELADNERQLIADALRDSLGSKKIAAARLGISPRTLRHKLQRLREAGLGLPGVDDAEAGDDDAG
jgi:two-component system response regulator FlrC